MHLNYKKRHEIVYKRASLFLSTLGEIKGFKKGAHASHWQFIIIVHNSWGSTRGNLGRSSEFLISGTPLRLLTGGPQCAMSNLGNGYVNCHYFANSHVDFKMVSCCKSNLRNIPCHVDKKKSQLDRLNFSC